MADIDRSVPADILKIARLALYTGLDQVHLMFEGLGSEFPAPIGWQVVITRVDPLYVLWLKDHDHDDQAEALSDTPEYLRVTTQIDSVATAFRSPGEPLWGIDEIAAWIRAPRAGIPEFTAKERAALELDADRMITAWKNGWSATRRLGRYTKAIGEDRAPDATAPMVVSFQYSALNNFFNVDGHPAHRSNGTDVSMDIFLSRGDVSSEHWLYSAIGRDRVTAHDALARIAHRAPWYADVACFDDCLQEWVD